MVSQSIKVLFKSQPLRFKQWPVRTLFGSKSVKCTVDICRYVTALGLDPETVRGVSEMWRDTYPDSASLQVFCTVESRSGRVCAFLSITVFTRLVRYNHTITGVKPRDTYVSCALHRVNGAICPSDWGWWPCRAGDPPGSRRRLRLATTGS